MVWTIEPIQLPKALTVFTAAEMRPPLTTLVKALKYRHAKVAAPILAGYLEPLLVHLPHLESSVLIPVPLHPRRLAERGHNQAQLLVEHLSKPTGWPVQSGLTRIRYTASQTGLNRVERKRNVTGAFAWRGPALQSITPVIVDDVITTGATLNACAEALRRAGAKAVYGLAAGRR